MSTAPQLQLVETPVQPEVMNITQAAAYLGVCTDKLYGYLNSGIVPGFKMGNRWKVKRSLLDEWIERESYKNALERGPAPRRHGDTEKAEAE